MKNTVGAAKRWKLANPKKPPRVYRESELSSLRNEARCKGFKDGAFAQREACAQAVLFGANVRDLATQIRAVPLVTEE